MKKYFTVEKLPIQVGKVANFKVTEGHARKMPGFGPGFAGEKILEDLGMKITKYFRKKK